MKVIILAGGFGTRLGNLTEAIPKPMLRIGERPVLWHIMKTCAHYGCRDFIVSLGYKADVVKEYFLHYDYYMNDFTVSLSKGARTVLTERDRPDWNVTLADTGVNTLKGARIKRLEHYLDDGINMVTYGDGIADVDVGALVAYHKDHGKTLTITGVHPPARFGEMVEEDGRITVFSEKPQASQGLINGGYMVFNRNFLDYLDADETCDLEREPLQRLTADGEVMVYKHEGSWECMDHERDYVHLNNLWRDGRAFWKVWD